MNNFSLIVPESVTFKQAIDLSQSLLSQVEAREIAEPEMARVISDLVKTENGARGFFVTYLTSESALADNPPNSVVEALRSHPEYVAELLVKNIAMSSAQAVYHRRNHADDMAQDSERVQRRTAQLIKLVNLPAVDDYAHQLLHSASTGEGTYKDFLERWGYDHEQRQAMSKALQHALSEA